MNLYTANLYPICFSNEVIAAFMPAYGPFMMVRFCAAIGIGGCMPAAASYLCEITPLSSRARYVNGNV